MDFAQRLKELRTQRGYSQSELANKLHLSKSTVSMLEVGSRKPSIEVMQLIADFFNVDMDYLIGNEPKSRYYLDPETAELAKEIAERRELKMLFDSVRNVSEEDMKLVIRLVEAMKNE